MFVFFDSNNDVLKFECKVCVVIFNGGKGNLDVKEYFVSLVVKLIKYEEIIGFG